MARSNFAEVATRAARGQGDRRDISGKTLRCLGKNQSTSDFEFNPMPYADRASLQQRGMIYESDESLWKINPKAKPYLDPKCRKELNHFLTRMVPESGKTAAVRSAEKFAGREDFCMAGDDLVGRG